jgi:osmotically-inducible protein OsmY
MPSQSSENRRNCLYQSIHKGCLNCTLTRPCPPLIVIATRYAEEMNIANDLEVPSTRTDPEIARDAQRVLKSNAMLSQARITAAVHQGFVTIEGDAEWNYQKYAAIEAVESVRGVRGVINQITVKTPESPSTIKQAIEVTFTD